MTAIVMDGDVAAAAIKADLVDRIAALAEQGVTPGLGTLLVGDDGPSARYVEMKHEDAAELGIASFDEHLPADVDPAAIDAVIDRCNADEAVDAYLCQYPFPPGFDYEAAPPAGRSGQGRRRAAPGEPGAAGDGHRRAVAVHARTASSACFVHYDVPIAGRHVVIVGRGLTIGRPLANLLSLKRPDANAAVTVVHTGVADIGALHPPGRHPRGRRRLAGDDHRRTW